MKKTLILSVALTALSGAAWAQMTQSPPRPPMSQGEQEQRCMEIVNEAQRLRCLNEIRPGAGPNMTGRSPLDAPPEIMETAPRPRDTRTPQDSRNPMALPEAPKR